MTRMSLPTGFSKGRTPYANPEMLVNAFVEVNDGDALAPFTIRSIPGYVTFSDLTTLGTKFRGAYRSLSDGIVYVVIDQTLYSIGATGSIGTLGTIVGSQRVFFADSESEIFIVAGNKGYTYNATEGLEQVGDPDFPGAASVTYLDGYFIFNNRQNGQKDQFFISSILDGETYDAAEFATAERYPDNLVRVFADKAELILFGTDSIEIWFNSNPSIAFPFARAQNSIIDEGLGALHSVQKVNSQVIWLDANGIVRRKEGLSAVRISTHEVEYAISLGDWTNAYSWEYTLHGHEFYVLTIKAANLTQTAGTYVWNSTTGKWHKQKSYERDYYGIGFYVKAYGKHLGFDIDTAHIYEMSDTIYDENGEALITELHFPPLNNDGKRFNIDEFELKMNSGEQGRQLGGQEFNITSFNAGAFFVGINSSSAIGKFVNGNLAEMTTFLLPGNRREGVFAYGIDVPRVFMTSGQSNSQTLRIHETTDGVDTATVNSDILGGNLVTNDGLTMMYAPPESGLGTGNGRLAWIGQDRSAYSDDLGVSWTVTSNLPGSVDFRTHGKGTWIPQWGKFYICGSAGAGGESETQISVSSDGITWTAETEITSIQSWRGLFYSAQDDLLVIGGRQGISPSRLAYKQGVGGTWTLASIDFNGLDSGNIIQGIAKDPFTGVWIAVAQSGGGEYFYSIDGKNWSARDSGLGDSWNDIAFDLLSRVFVVGGNNDFAKYDAATDTWTNLSAAGTNMSGMLVNAVIPAAFLESSGEITNVFSEFNTGAEAMLRTSKNGRTYSKTQPVRSIGAKGEYNKRIVWRRLGQYEDFYPVVTISKPIHRAVCAAYIMVDPYDD